MYPEVVREALSAILDANIISLSNSKVSDTKNVLTIRKFIPAVYEEALLDPVTVLAQSVKSLIIETSPASSKECREESSNSAIRREFFIDEKEFFDPCYDFDFTNITDSNVFMRGGEVYKRPCGWNRIALKVYGKYDDGNAWLGCGSEAWPVSYHGTTFEGAKGIIESGYRVGSGAAYGRGIYSTPDITVAGNHGYAKIFKSKTTGKTYKTVLQNRINPKYREICVKNDYWLVPVPMGTSAVREKEIVTSAIRPYGLLLKEV